MRDDLYIAAKIVVKKDCREEFLALAQELVAASSSEEGNIFYTLTESLSDPELFIVMEHWKSQAAIDFHNSTPHFARLAAFARKNSLQISVDVGRPVVSA